MSGKRAGAAFAYSNNYYSFFLYGGDGGNEPSTLGEEHTFTRNNYLLFDLFLFYFIFSHLTFFKFHLYSMSLVSDLWRYDVSTRKWSWVTGFQGGRAVYPTLGVQ